MLPATILWTFYLVKSFLKELGGWAKREFKLYERVFGGKGLFP